MTMKRISHLLLTAALLLPALTTAIQGQGKPVLIINMFTTAADVKVPYDMKQLQASAVAEFGVMLKDVDVVAEKPKAPQGPVYTLDVQITGWRPGNAAKRVLVGFGSGREAADISYQVTDPDKKKVVEHVDTIRTNFYSQGSGSSGTLGHPFAQKITERIKDAKLFGLK
jgi:hypothetical protein